MRQSLKNKFTNHKNLDLSIIIPVYNCQDWITENLFKVEEFLS